MFKDVYKLLPGHILTFERGKVVCRRYWDVPTGHDSSEPAQSREDDVRRFRDLLEESIRLRLMSDVPLGVFLSGGIDSSAIAGLMARRVGRLQTFSVAFEDRACNELAYAREAATTIGAENHEVIVGERDFFGALPRLIWHEDEPITWPSSVSLYFVSQLARKHVTVVLTGEGSDEMFGGYARYRHFAMNQRWLGRYRMVPGPVRRAIRSQVATTPLLNSSLRLSTICIL
jgi:asparagine synthase (glutamine-hydrolysing)